MRFAAIEYVYLFLIVPLVIVFLIYAYRKRKKLLDILVEKKLQSKISIFLDEKRLIIKYILIILVFVFCILSLLRPQWGFHWEKIKRVGVDIVVIIDTSKSMLAEDIKPSRLLRAKMEIKDLINMLEGDRIGIIAFAGSSFVLCPLTMDYSAAMLFVENISTDLIPRPGTDIGGAIFKAIKLFERGGMGKNKVIILITDGEDLEGDALEAAKVAAARGIKIFTIGIGSPEGVLIPIRKGGKKEYLKDREGKIVLTKLDEATLKKIALYTGAAYTRATTEGTELELIYKKRIRKLEKTELKSSLHKKFEERYQWPLGIALGLLIIELFINPRRKI